MPPVSPGLDSDPDRHGRRAVWIAALITIIGAGIVYADKAAEDRSAFIRWRPQVRMMMAGANIYDDHIFPNPTIMPLTLYPIMALPPVEGAMVWFSLKAGMAALSLLICLRMVRLGDRPVPSWVQAMIVVLSLRPIMSDLSHGNNNIYILFLIAATLAAWRKGYDVLAGLILAYAIAFKVTPGLFLVYFAYKRSWRTVGATVLGLGLFFLVVPSLLLGYEFNTICLTSWWHRILNPYVEGGVIGDQEINQSMVGVLSRLLTESHRVGRYGIKIRVNFVNWDPKVVVTLIKGLSLALVGLLAWLCRTKSVRRDDPRLLGEFSLVVLTMLFVSERSWKHHYVTLLLPYTYLAYRVGVAGLTKRTRWALGAALVASALLIATTSSEIGKPFAHGQGHKVAQAYGMFFWSGVVVYIATAWRVVAEGRISPSEIGLASEAGSPSLQGPHSRLAALIRRDRESPRPHVV